MQIPDFALVFDFDGVVLDSATLKRQAFADMYQHMPATQHRAIVAYLNRRGGQPREVKFRHIEAHILGRKAGDARIHELCEQFKASVEERLLQAPLIPGAIEFLTRWHAKRAIYLLSATPQNELTSIVEQRQLNSYFDEVIGAPPDKATGLGSLLSRQSHVAKQTVMIGDSYNDYRAARSNGTLFVGVAAQPQRSPFPSDTQVINDLHSLETALTKLV